MRIDPARQDWMTAPATLAVMQALGEARFVGGAVRDALTQRAVTDIDIATPLTPQEVMARLAAAHIKSVPTGIDHGTVTAVVSGKPFEITTLRRDTETDGRHAKVAFTDDWEEDAKRRDFTMNALYVGMDGEIFDYASGVEDLIAGRVRFMGDPAKRIAEDYLRILRLFRFHAWYGKGEIDSEALRAAAAGKAGLAQLSGERVQKEMLRLLESPDPAPVLRIMAAAGILPDLLPGALLLPRLERLAVIDAENGFAPDAVLRLAALLPDNKQSARDVAKKLRLSNAHAARLDDLAQAEENIATSVQQARKNLYRLGPARFADRVFLKWAGGQGNPIQWRMLLSMARDWRQPKFPLTGHDLMQAGVPEGPVLGEILAEVEAWWIENDFPD
ncbi:MAG TPA: CCA tRNA nucleotidyltransferase, partial [Rhizomicrobium sp.]